MRSPSVALVAVSALAALLSVSSPIRADGDYASIDPSEAPPCPWVELSGLEASPESCNRVFRQKDIHVDEESSFLLFAPGPEHCAKIWKIRRRLSCPNVIFPVPASLSSPEVPLLPKPPSFFKMTLETSGSFTHAVDMIPVGQDIYLFTMVPVEEGLATAALHLDFSECQGRNMLGKSTVRVCASKAAFHKLSPQPCCALCLPYRSKPSRHGTL